MKYVLAIAAAASIWTAIPASAEEVGVGVGVGPAGPGVTIGSDRRDLDRDRGDRGRTVIKEHEPRDRTVIKERDGEPDRRVMIDRETKAVARVAGQREDYLLKALHDYKSGVRSGGGMAAMAEVAYPLSEEEITALAHYLAHL